MLPESLPWRKNHDPSRKEGGTSRERNEDTVPRVRGRSIVLDDFSVGRRNGDAQYRIAAGPMRRSYKTGYIKIRTKERRKSHESLETILHLLHTYTIRRFTLRFSLREASSKRGRGWDRADRPRTRASFKHPSNDTEQGQTSKSTISGRAYSVRLSHDDKIKHFFFNTFST